MWFALALGTVAIAGGTLATYAYDPRARLLQRVCAGVCTGLAAFGLAGFLFASLAGLRTATLLAAALAIATPLALLGRSHVRRHVRRDLASELQRARHAFVTRTWRRAALALLWVAGVGSLWRIFSRMIEQRPDGLYTGTAHNLGDLPLHLSVIARFVAGNNLPPEHPEYAGTPFTYHFLADFLTAMFVTAGAPVRGAIAAVSLGLVLAFAGLLHRWSRDLTGSIAVARLTPLVVFLGGGLGWWLVLRDAAAHEAGIWGLLASLPRDYTIRPGHDWRWGNMITTLLIPQRALLLGLPLAIVIFQQWWLALDAPDQRPARRMAAAGVIAGLLPLVHAHGYLIVLTAAAFMTLATRRWRLWSLFFACAVLLGAPQAWWIAQGSAVNGAQFVAWSPGWDRGDRNVILFWLLNTGALLPLLLIALCWRGPRPAVSRRLLLFYAPFAIWFLLANLLRLSPWIWDNIKILVYWFIASAPIAALALVRMWHGRLWRRALAVAAFVTLTLAGTLDLCRVLSGRAAVRVFNRADARFATVVTRATTPHALVLHAPAFDHPVLLSGRRSFMGYPGHLWSHGLSYTAREADVQHIYAGGADAMALLARHRIDYIVIGPSERTLLTVNDRFLARYPIVAEAGGYRLLWTGASQRLVDRSAAEERP